MKINSNKLKSSHVLCTNFCRLLSLYVFSILLRLTFYFHRLCIKSMCKSRGLKHAGRMWPARSICAAREHLNNWQNYTYLSNLVCFESFSCKLWPSDTFEFETSVLKGQFPISVWLLTLRYGLNLIKVLGSINLTELGA